VATKNSTQLKLPTAGEIDLPLSGDEIERLKHHRPSVLGIRCRRTNCKKDLHCFDPKRHERVQETRVDEENRCINCGLKLKSKRRKGLCLPLNVEKIPVADAKALQRNLREVAAGSPKIDELIGILIRQGPDQNGIQQAENGGIRTDAEGEGEDRHSGEAWILAQRAQRETNVLHECVKTSAYAYGTDLLLHLFHAAKFNPCRAASLRRVRAFSNLFIGEQFEGGLNFFVKLCFSLLTMEQAMPETLEPCVQ
jgi:hypothetical protein